MNRHRAILFDAGRNTKCGYDNIMNEDSTIFTYHGQHKRKTYDNIFVIGNMYYVARRHSSYGWLDVYSARMETHVHQRTSQSPPSYKFDVVKNEFISSSLRKLHNSGKKYITKDDVVKAIYFNSGQLPPRFQNYDGKIQQGILLLTAP